MVFLAVVLLGAISVARLPIDLLPEVSYPRLVIYTTLAETAPAEIERLITEPVEGSVATTPSVEKVTSISREGVSLVTLRFAWGTNMDFAMLNVREKLDNVRQRLPEQASRPRILRVDPESEPIMVLSVAGESLSSTKELAETVFRRRLEQLDGVAQVTVAGGLEQEIQVIVDPERLESYGLSIQDVATALANANRAGSGGTILQGALRYPLRTLGEFRTIAEMEDVVVGRAGAGEGRTVRVSDVGQVVDGFADRDVLARYNGQEAVGLLLFKESGANTVQVAQQVDGVLDLLRAEFPDVTVDIASSQAGFIRDSILNVILNIVEGGVLAFLVLFLFLREPRYPLVVALSMPVSLIGTFALMDAFGVSLNIMSLGGLALGVGMLMDNSIIVLENIFRHRELIEGGTEAAAAGAVVAATTEAPARETPMDTAARGTEEVMGAITASTLTTIAVFGPIIYVKGVAGELFRDLSLSVAFSLLASLVVAFTLLPAITARFGTGKVSETLGPAPLRPGPRPRGFWRTTGWLLHTLWRLPLWMFQGLKAVGRELVLFWWGGINRAGSALFKRPLDAFDRGYDRFAHTYHKALDWSLDHRALVLALSAGALVLTFFGGSTLERDLLPQVDQGSFEVGLELPQGTSLQRTDEVARALEQVMMEDPDVEAVFGTVGRDVRRFAQSDDATGLHTARFQVRLSDDVATAPVVERLRERLVAAAPDGVVTLVTGQATALGQMLGGSDADISVRIRGEDMDQAFGYADEVVPTLEGLSSISNVRVGAERGQPQFEVEVLREAANRYGLQPMQVATAVEQGMRGVQATEFIAFDRKIPVMVRIPDELRYDVNTLERLQLNGVPLRELVSVNLAMGPAEIRREDQGRVVSVLADVREGGLDGAIQDVEEAVAATPVPDDFRVDVGGENEEMRRSFRDLALAFALAVILVYMILAAQFESFVHPAVILAAAPLALIGAVIALLITGQGISTISLIGAVILVGIVDNDAIVKVEFIVQARERGASVRDAIIEAGRVRLRPIIMTTVTTVVGLMPMALGFGPGADLRAPLAIVVIGGLTVATLLTLVVVPVLFSVTEDVRVALGGEAIRSRQAVPGAGTEAERGLSSLAQPERVG
jgi:HAE1 family hydrophobic/amphiphilic exporter-1